MCVLGGVCVCVRRSVFVWVNSVFICHSLVLSEGYVRSTPLYTVYVCVCVCVYVGVCVAALLSVKVTGL